MDDMWKINIHIIEDDQFQWLEETDIDSCFYIDGHGLYLDINVNEKVDSIISDADIQPMILVIKGYKEFRVLNSDKTWVENGIMGDELVIISYDLDNPFIPKSM